MFHSYRGPLAKMIRQAGFSVRWVGSQSTRDDEPTLLHDGYPGKPIQYLVANMPRIYSAHPADIILLHAGHNHSAEEMPVSGIIASTGKSFILPDDQSPRHSLACPGNPKR